MAYSEHSGFDHEENGIIWKVLFRSRRLISLMASSVLLVAMINFVWAHWQAPINVAKPQGAWGSLDTSRYLLRLSGSTTIGSDLVPKLVAAWLTSIGARDVEATQRREAGGQNIPETLVSAKLNGNPVLVEVKAHGSASAFADLANGTADIGMTSREINSSEVTRLMSLGYMRAAASEHILGTESVAVVVPKSNTVSSLPLSVVKKIFSGEIRNWSAIGLKSQAIHLYARDNNSGIYQTFSSLVLGDVQMADAKRYQDSEKLDADVASDPGGIGFIGIPYVKDTRTVSITDGNTAGHSLTPFTEGYALTRRVYLYTAALPDNTAASDFIRFTNSPEGQDIVRENHFALQPEEDIDSSKELAGNRPAQSVRVKTPVTEASAITTLPASPAPALPRSSSAANFLTSVREASVIRSVPDTAATVLQPPLVGNLPQRASERTDARITVTSDPALQPAPKPVQKALVPLSLPVTTPALPPAVKIAPPALPSPPAPPVALTSHAVTADDYPLMSIRLQEEGNVVIKYLVKEDGSVGECDVTASSGKSLLDKAACAMVQRQWKFKPAMQNGKPVSELLTAEVVFKLNDDVAKDSKTPLDGLVSLITGLL